MDYMRLIKEELFNLTNQVRMGFLLNPLSYSHYLDRMGQIHTNEMYTHKFFDHENPHNPIVHNISDRVKYCGLSQFYDMVGENLADFPAVNDKIIVSSNGQIMNKEPRELLPSEILCRNIIKGWFHSPGHRANLLCPEYNYVGFGLLLYPKICHGVKLKYLLATQNLGRGI